MGFIATLVAGGVAGLLAQLLIKTKTDPLVDLVLGANVMTSISRA